MLWLESEFRKPRLEMRYIVVSKSFRCPLALGFEEKCKGVGSFGALIRITESHRVNHEPNFRPVNDRLFYTSGSGDVRANLPFQI